MAPYMCPLRKPSEGDTQRADARWYSAGSTLAVGKRVPRQRQVRAGFGRLAFLRLRFLEALQRCLFGVVCLEQKIELGHVHDGMMVNLRSDNAKLRARAQGIVGRIAGISDKAADAALAATDGDVKAATLVAAGAGSVDAAHRLLDETGGHLRPALDRITLISKEKLTS